MRAAIWVSVLVLATGMFAGSYSAYGGSASAMAYCAIKWKECRDQVDKELAMMNQSHPCFAFDKCIAYARCDFHRCLCQCTGEGAGNEYSNEPGTVMACQTQCKSLMDVCKEEGKRCAEYNKNKGKKH